MICTKCNIDKSLNEFHKSSKNKSGRFSYCKDCRCSYDQHRNSSKYQTELRKSRNSKSREEIRYYILNYLKQHSCVNCGESDPIVLDFAHIDRSTKEFNVSHAIQKRYSLNSIKKEINKCKVLCSNCHRRETSFESNSYKLLLSGVMASTSGFEPDRRGS